jgi:hypothetical protein
MQRLCRSNQLLNPRYTHGRGIEVRLYVKLQVLFLFQLVRLNTGRRNLLFVGQGKNARLTDTHVPQILSGYSLLHRFNFT